MASAPGIARAEPAAPSPPSESSPATAIDADAVRLADGNSVRSNWQPPGLSDRYGHAEVLVAAPLSVVGKLVEDYGHYRDFTGGKFHTSRIISQEPRGTDVYFRLPLLDGMITLWQVFRFQELKPMAPGWMMVEGWYVKGNIGRGNAAWTLHAVDDTHTVVKFDLLVKPNMAMPQSLLDAGLRNAAAQAVDSIRDHAQATPGPVAYDIARASRAAVTAQ